MVRVIIRQIRGLGQIEGAGRLDLVRLALVVHEVRGPVNLPVVPRATVWFGVVRPSGVLSRRDPLYHLDDGVGNLSNDEHIEQAVGNAPTLNTPEVCDPLVNQV